MHERHGVELTREVEADIIDQIKSGNAVFIEKQSLRVSMYKIKVDEKEITILYDKKRRQIITAIPKEDSPLNRDNYTNDI